MKLTQILRNGMIGTLIAMVPVTTSLAATRPNAAVPMSSSAATSVAMADNQDDHEISWVAIGLGVLAIAIFAVLVLDKDNDSVSNG